MTSHAIKPDLGADGPAALARQFTDTKLVGSTRVVARTVAADPLDHYAAAGQINDRQHDAGMRLRTAIENGWPSGRTTATPMYASAPGLDDELYEIASEEDQWEAQKKCWQDQKDAEKYVGQQFWSTVKGVCSGGWATSYGGLRMLQLGLDNLAEGWRIASK